MAVEFYIRISEYNLLQPKNTREVKYTLGPYKTEAEALDCYYIAYDCFKEEEEPDGTVIVWDEKIIKVGDSNDVECAC